MFETISKSIPVLDQRRKVFFDFDPTQLTPPFPKTALIELSNWCNHGCIFCTNPRANRKKGFLSLDLYRRFLDQSVPLGLKEIGLYTTGEPFFVKELPQFVSLARDAGLKYIFLTTNGALATPEKQKAVFDAGLSSIKFSVNAATRETYKLVHGKDDFEQVLNNIKFAYDYRNAQKLTHKIFVSFVVTKYTESQKSLAEELFLPFVDEINFYGCNIQGGQNLDQLEMLASTMTPEPFKGPCSMLWNRIHLTYEGYLNLCCIDYENALTYSDFNQTDLSDGWNNLLMTEMRRKHRDQELDGTLCKNCLYGVKDSVYPISSIGHSDPSREMQADDQKGALWVTSRILELQKQS